MMHHHHPAQLPIRHAAEWLIHHRIELLIALGVLLLLAVAGRLVIGNPRAARHRVRILRWRIRFYLRPGPGYANILELAVRWSRLRAVRIGRRSRSLADGSFRLVIVLDSAPDELVQVVGYLQSVTDKIDIDLVTVAAYDVGGSQVLVPRRIEPGSRPRQLTDAQVSARQAGTRFPGSTEFRTAISDAPSGQGFGIVALCPFW